MSNEILLYQIPVYSMTEEKFNKKFYNKFLKEYEGHPNFESIKELMRPQSTWRYNQIIGYITISIQKNDIIFEAYKVMQKVYVFAVKKKYIQCLFINGFHFNATDLSKEEISNKISRFVNEIGKQYFKNRFIDAQVLENTLDHLDYSRLIGDR